LVGSLAQRSHSDVDEKASGIRDLTDVGQCADLCRQRVTLLAQDLARKVILGADEQDLVP
jgi:hypothetical protein